MATEVAGAGAGTEVAGGERRMTRRTRDCSHIGRNSQSKPSHKRLYCKSSTRQARSCGRSSPPLPLEDGVRHPAAEHGLNHAGVSHAAAGWES